MTPRREFFGFWLVALATTLAIAPAGPSYWDSFGYAAQSVTGQVGGLALGRPLFIFIGHQLVRLALGLGADVSSLEPMLRYFWSALAALSAPMMWLLADALGLSPSASRWAALCVAHVVVIVIGVVKAGKGQVFENRIAIPFIRR